MKVLTRVSLLAGALAVVPLAGAQERQASSFLEQAAEINAAEMELAEVAQERAASEDVKNYAQHIQQDHELANEKLQSIAEQKEVQLPDEPGRMHQQQKERLSELEGETFDSQYVQTMIEGHKKAIQQYEQQAKTAQDPQVKQYAELTLPQLRAHLKQAQQLQQQLQQGSQRRTQQESQQR